MAFDKVDPKVDFPPQERDVLAFWERTGAFDKLRELNRDKTQVVVSGLPGGQAVDEAV